MKTNIRHSFFAKFKKALTSPTTSALANLANLIFASIAVITSIIAIHNANYQFRENSKSADSLFRYQINHAEEINNKLIAHIEDLQQTSQIQLRTAQLDFNNTQQFQSAQILTGRPVLDFDSIVTENVHDVFGLYSPQILIWIKNSGIRSALNVQYSIFVVDSSKSVILGTSTTSSQKIGSMRSIPISIKPHFNYKFKSGFCLFLRASFKDPVQSKFSDSLCSNKYNEREQEVWADCDESDLKAISALLHKSKFNWRVAR